MLHSHVFVQRSLNEKWFVASRALQRSAVFDFVYFVYNFRATLKVAVGARECLVIVIQVCAFVFCRLCFACCFVAVAIASLSRDSLMLIVGLVFGLAVGITLGLAHLLTTLD